MKLGVALEIQQISYSECSSEADDVVVNLITTLNSVIEKPATTLSSHKMQGGERKKEAIVGFEVLIR